MSKHSVQIFQCSQEIQSLLIGFVWTKETQRKYTMNLRESKKQKLLTLINQYLSQSNIKMKYVLKKYQKKLIEGKSLTERELESMIPLLVHNMRMSRDQVRGYFSELTQIPRPVREKMNTLEEFFV